MNFIAPTGFEPMYAGPKPAVLGLYTTGLLIIPWFCEFIIVDLCE